MKSNLERLAEAREAVRRDEAERRERSEPYNAPECYTIDTSSSEFRRNNPFYDDGEYHGSEDC